MSRIPIVLVFAAILLVATCVKARAADIQPVDCEIIRAKVAEHGKAAAIAWALAQGYAWRDIQRIRKTCGV